MHMYTRLISLATAALLLVACNEAVTNPQHRAGLPVLVPDYTEVTIPVGIAPLNFTFPEAFERINAVVEGEQGGRIEVQGKNGIQLPEGDWATLLETNKGAPIRITVSVKQEGRWSVYDPFPVYVSNEPIDYGLAYRLIAPGYEVYSKMGIYQRRLADFRQTPIIENTLVPGSCVNCHSFRGTVPGDMSLHVRGPHGGTLLQTGGQLDMISLKAAETAIGGVYPYWHPSGRYIAYSQNNTRQVFHAASDKRVEVFDLASDLTVYDIEANKLLTTPLLQTADFETFPAFSPDGKSLYFCLSEGKEMPVEYEDVHYNLCRIDFDPATGAFGNRVDTLVNAADRGKSISFPRPSYDGRYLMYTLSDYGNFSIWHKEADLWLLDLQTGETRALDEVNSPDTESYHSWSSNSHWFVFSSRRQDGLYTRLYIASIGADGRATKPFLLPQQQAEACDRSFYSYNVPEFISGPVDLDIREAERRILSPGRKQAGH